MWPFRHRHVPEQRPHPDADKAIERAQAELERIKRQEPEVRQLAEFLRERRQSNHFGEGLMQILRGDGPK